MELTMLEKKLLVLAMDSGAAKGEVEACAVRLLSMFRSRYPNGYALIKDLEAAPEHRPRIDVSGYYRMPFGMYKGDPLNKVPEHYLRFALDNFHDMWPETREAIEDWLENCEGGGDGCPF